MTDHPDRRAPVSGDLTDAAYWGRRQEATAANPLRDRPPVWLPAVEPYLRLYEGQRFLELGCSPGLVSAAICQRVAFRRREWTPQADRYLETMQQIGVADARLHRCDIREFHPEQPYDVVASFGLVEHFDDPLSILRQHDRLLRPGGLCVVVVPPSEGSNTSTTTCSTGQTSGCITSTPCTWRCTRPLRRSGNMKSSFSRCLAPSTSGTST